MVTTEIRGRQVKMGFRPSQFSMVTSDKIQINKIENASSPFIAVVSSNVLAKSS